MYDLNLEGERNEVLTNLLSDSEKGELLEQVDRLGIRNHTLLFSSGTTGGPMKGYLLSREALLKNAKAVNERLGLTPSDLWGASLPFYHIGGLSIFYRAWLLGSRPVDLRPWKPETLSARITDEKVTVLSLVPAQLYDLVSLGSRAPEHLRAVLLGGDFLSEELEMKAKSLGWPVVRTFGMSEVCSQLCTGADAGGFLIPLPIHSVSTNETGQLLVKSESLFSYIVKRSESGWSFTFSETLKNEEGLYPLPDRVTLKNGHLRHLGRLDEGVKVSGHLVDLGILKEQLDRLLLREKLWGEMELVMRPSAREGVSLILHVTPKVSVSIIDEFKKIISPVKVEVTSHQESLQRTELGKFKRPSSSRYH